MGKSKIEWTDKTWNPVTGCTKVSEGCRNCYAEKMAGRLKAMGQEKYKDGFAVRTHPDCLDEPLRWKKPCRIFVCSMGDLFHDDVPFYFIDEVMDAMFRSPQHTYILLTKRPRRMSEFFEAMSDDNHDGSPWRDVPNPNIHLGVSVEDQEAADERIPYLLQTPAAKRFISIEPMLGPVNLALWFFEPTGNFRTHKGKRQLELRAAPKLDGVILGGESGPGARPMHPDWARKIRDDCEAAGVPFFFKQWGEWVPAFHDNQNYYSKGREIQFEGHFFRRIGKKKAGALLDGKEYKDLP